MSIFYNSVCRQMRTFASGKQGRDKILRIVMKEGLIGKYQPADYSDSLSKDFVVHKQITVDELFDSMFCNFSCYVRAMLKLRDVMVKPLKLKTGATFRDRVIERNNEEIIVGATDKHLSFWVSVYCSLPKDDCQTASVNTVVKFHNILGRLYFAFIWVFHKLIVSGLFRRAISSAFSSERTYKSM